MSSRRSAGIGILVGLCQVLPSATPSINGPERLRAGANYSQGIAGNRECLRYEPETVSVTGTLIRRTFYGAPGFGDDPAKDEKETGFYLELAAPICMAGNGDDINVAMSDVRLIQLLLDQRGYDSLRSVLGNTVTLHGTLFAAHTGHHHAPILLTPAQPVRIER